MIADRMLWVAADEKTIVEHGDALAAILLAGPGHAISDTEVKKFGLVCDADGRVSQASAEPPKVEEPEAKEQPKPEDKQEAKPADKAVKKPVTKRRSKRRT